MDTLPYVLRPYQGLDVVGPPPRERIWHSGGGGNRGTRTQPIGPRNPQRAASGPLQLAPWVRRRELVWPAAPCRDGAVRVGPTFRDSRQPSTLNGSKRMEWTNGTYCLQRELPSPTFGV